MQIVIKQNIQAFEIPMQNWWVEHMKVVYCTCNLQGYSPTLFPLELDRRVLQQRPERPTLAVLHDNGVVRRFGARPDKHDDVRMTDCFHCMTFTEKISNTHITGFYLKFLDCDDSLSPLRLVDNTIASFADVTFKFELLPVDLQVGIECSILADTAHLEF